MRGLGLIALLVVLALAYGGMTGNRAPSAPAAASGKGLPVAFVSGEAAWPDRPVKTVYNLEPRDNFTSAPWPFVAQRIHFACADGGLMVVQGGSQYAALNGHTSGLSQRYQVKDDRGSRSPIASGENNQRYRDAGIVRQDAQDLSIGQWWSALSERLLRDCAS